MDQLDEDRPAGPTALDQFLIADFQTLARLYMSISSRIDTQINVFLVGVGAVAALVSRAIEFPLANKPEVAALVALALLVILALGEVIYVRSIDSNISAFNYLRAMNMIRARFTDKYPELQQSLKLPVTAGQPRFTQLAELNTPHAWTKGVLIGPSGIAAVLNDGLCAAAAYVVVGEVFSGGLVLGLVGSVVGFGLAHWLHVRYRNWRVDWAQERYGRDDR
jgi:hypothetical protein